jgi:rod shape-determining protein MreD
MGRELITLIIRFVLLVLLQVLVLNQVQFTGILNPYLYLYFILVLPVDFNPNMGLIVGFALGLTIDLFSQTLGMHTIATVFAAYCRPYALRYMAPRDGYESSRIPGIKQMGWLWFLTYAAIIILFHHFVLFFMESFKMSGLWFTLGKSIGSGILTLSLVIIVEMLFARRARKGSGYD